MYRKCYKEKEGGGQLAKKSSKKRKTIAPSSSEKFGGSDGDMGQETLSQLACDEEVRMISLVFNSTVKKIL